ncbi:uncharacterized protein METZ01_LOCUS52211, partial [marine metagenome]
GDGRRQPGRRAGRSQRPRRPPGHPVRDRGVVVRPTGGPRRGPPPDRPGHRRGLRAGRSGASGSRRADRM